MKPLLISLCLALALPATVAPAAAAAPGGELENVARLRTIVSAFVAGEQPGSSVAMPSLDARLRLPACAQRPEAFDAPGSRGGPRRTVGLRCPGGWTIYVPVRITQMVSMVRLRRAATPGEALRAEDLELVQHPAERMPLGHVGTLEQAVGRIPRQALAPGTLLRPTHLRAGRAVQRGQAVRLVLERAGLRIESTGEALEDAAVGAWVQARNTYSGRIVEGRVSAPGLITVP